MATGQEILIVILVVGIWWIGHEIVYNNKM